MILPRHIAEQRARELKSQQLGSREAANPYQLDTDEFISPAQVKDQLETLRAHLTLQRKMHPTYHLPKPVGWKLAILMLTLPEVTSGGLELVTESRDAHAMSSPQGVVLALGLSCYTDPDRFTVDGKLTPWTNPGDRVTWVKYDVASFKLGNGQLLGFLSDTQPVSIIDHGWEVPA